MKRLTRTGITALICAAIGTVFYLSPAYADKVASSEIADGYMGATAIRLYDQGGMETEVSAVEGNKITISGISKEKVGQYAAEIRDKRRPEPYKGKGIKYSDEIIRRKVGKTGKK